MIVLLLAVSLFARDFAGSWSCIVTLHPASGAAPVTYRERIEIDEVTNAWTRVRWSGRGSGTAFVGRFQGSPVWLYDDYWDDGHFFRDLSHDPDSAGRWQWFDADDQVHMNHAAGPQTWQRLSPTRFVQHFAQSIHGHVRDLGSAQCSANPRL